MGSIKGEDDEQRKGSNVTNPTTLDTTVTLAVTLEEARRLVQVEEVGRELGFAGVRLALRHRADTGSALRR